LTDQRKSTADRIEIRNAQFKLARFKWVTFSFSATALDEAVGLTPDGAHFTELKADFSSDLCGSNALVSFDRPSLEKAVEMTIAREVFASQRVSAQRSFTHLVLLRRC
jgi:hypothetical protein